jgi:hypothetical protein
MKTEEIKPEDLMLKLANRVANIDDLKKWIEIFNDIETAADFAEKFDNPSEAYKWYTEGLYVDDAYEWKSCNFTPHEATEWREAGFFDPHEAREWANHGISPEDAEHWKELGFTPELAAKAAELKKTELKKEI